MVELIGAHGFDEAKIVDVLFQMWQAVRHPLAAFSRLMKGILRAQQLGHAADEGKALAGQEGSRAVLAIELGQFGFVIEEFQLARRAGHVQIDDALGAGGKLRRQD